jgi:hypothetical protein
MIFGAAPSAHKCFTFENDMLDHKRIEGHTEISKVDLGSYNKKVDSESENELGWQMQNR